MKPKSEQQRVSEFMKEWHGQYPTPETPTSPTTEAFSDGCKVTELCFAGKSHAIQDVITSVNEHALLNEIAEQFKWTHEMLQRARKELPLDSLVGFSDRMLIDAQALQQLQTLRTEGREYETSTC